MGVPRLRADFVPLLRNWTEIRHERMQHGVVQTTAADAIAVHEHNNRRILIREAMETRHETRDLATVALCTHTLVWTDGPAETVLGVLSVRQDD